MLDLEKYKLILGSKSSRRAELLELLDWDFVQVDINADESFPDSMDKYAVAEHLAWKKANAYGRLQENELLITADTIVLLDGEILGKPSSTVEAVEMISKLQNDQHEVITGVGLRTLGHTSTFSAVTEVKFGPLSEEEIEYYVNTYKPLDKAGAYGVQEWIGAIGVESLSGSYYNVMGLPVQALYAEMKTFLQVEKEQ